MMMIFILTGGVIAVSAALAIYSYVYPIILAKIILAAFLRMRD